MRKFQGFTVYDRLHEKQHLPGKIQGTHAYMYARIHTFTHARTHEICACKGKYRVCIHTYTPAYTHSHVHARTKAVLENKKMVSYMLLYVYMCAAWARTSSAQIYVYI